MKLVKKNQKLHDSDSPLLIGDVKESDVVYEVNEPSYIETYEKVLPLWKNTNWRENLCVIFLAICICNSLHGFYNHNL